MFLIDKSTNGTHIIPEGRDSIYIRREEAPLSNTGMISFSKDEGDSGPHIIQYSC